MHIFRYVFDSDNTHFALKRRDFKWNRLAALNLCFDAFADGQPVSTWPGNALVVIVAFFHAFAQRQSRKCLQRDRCTDILASIFNHFADLVFTIDHKNLLKQN